MSDNCTEEGRWLVMEDTSPVYVGLVCETHLQDALREDGTIATWAVDLVTLRETGDIAISNPPAALAVGFGHDLAIAAESGMAELTGGLRDRFVAIVNNAILTMAAAQRAENIPDFRAWQNELAESGIPGWPDTVG